MEDKVGRGLRAVDTRSAFLFVAFDREGANAKTRFLNDGYASALQICFHIRQIGKEKGHLGFRSPLGNSTE